MLRTRLAIFGWTLLLLSVAGQDIVFPSDDDSDMHVSGGKPITERKPVKSPQCREHMLLYADEGPRSGWVCDCKPYYVYFPLNDTCYEAFKQGPCPDHHYVYLPLNESLPSCVPNPCRQEGRVPYAGNCHQIGAKTGGPCKGKNEILGINETTFQLQCIDTSIKPFVIIDAPKRACPKGSKRNNLGICKLVL